MDLCDGTGGSQSWTVWLLVRGILTFSEHIGEARRKKLKYNVMKPIEEKLGLTIVNWNKIESDKDINRYEFSYESVVQDYMDKIQSTVIIENSLLSYSFPTNFCEISNYVYDYMHENRCQLTRQ